MIQSRFVFIPISNSTFLIIFKKNIIMNPLIVIPARFSSTRFPGKPLVLINGKPMIQHVWERCKSTCEQVVVATDDHRIFNAVEAFRGKCVMTSPNHNSGTDRCAETARRMDTELIFDIVINVQGDEPFIEKEQINKLIDCFSDPDTEIATLISPIKESESLFNPNKVKVVTSNNGFALYFSRQPIPYQRDVPEQNWLDNIQYYSHIGMYGFKKEVLLKVADLEQTPLEISEKLEQLRWLENNFKIKTAVTFTENQGIDTPEDLEKIII